MPTYIYKREDGSTFELNQRISEASLTVCPTTGQAVKRVITGGAGVIYKGEGWYITDYKNAGKKREDSSGAEVSKPASDSTKTETKSSEPKPEVAPAAKTEN